MSATASTLRSGRKRNGKELWKDVPGFGDFYMASTRGRVKSKARIVKKRSKSGKIIEQKYQEKILSGSIDSEGYIRLHLSIDGKKISVPQHHMVLFAFVGPRPEGMEACHLDNRPWNNRPENLRWDTHFNNNQDRKRAGHYAVGVAHPMSRITDDVAKAIAEAAMPTAEISRIYGVSISQVHRIKKSKAWKHLDANRTPAPGKIYDRTPRGENAGGAKLFEDDVRAIRASELSQNNLARHYGVTQPTISAIKLRQTWAHVE